MYVQTVILYYKDAPSNSVVQVVLLVLCDD